MSSAYVSSDEIRDQFSSAMSAMYQQEVPQYGTLLSLVEAVNREVLAANPELNGALQESDELARINVERHGAIRVGSADELAMLRRMFAVMGMEPVGYYDLAAAGVPVRDFDASWVQQVGRPDDAMMRPDAFPLMCLIYRVMTCRCTCE